MEDLILIVGGAVEGAGLATQWSPENSHWSRLEFPLFARFSEFGVLPQKIMVIEMI